MDPCTSQLLSVTERRIDQFRAPIPLLATRIKAPKADPSKDESDAEEDHPQTRSVRPSHPIDFKLKLRFIVGFIQASAAVLPHGDPRG